MLQTTPSRLCGHCGTARIVRPRGLCARCYDAPSVRMLYPARTTNRPDASTRERRLPRFPTSALPGTPAKLVVFQKRLRQRVQLFHPLDA